jgi:starvation-inducible outer membrane lipoprotein
MKILFILLILTLAACSTTPPTREEQESRIENARKFRQFHHTV